MKRTRGSLTKRVSFWSLTWMKLRGTVTSVNPRHLSVLYGLLTLGNGDPGLIFRVRYGPDPYLRWVALCNGFPWNKKRPAAFLEATRNPQATWNLPEICRRKLETFRFAPLTRTWGKRRRAGVLALLHVASCVIRVKLNAISLRLVPVGKPPHDNLKLVKHIAVEDGVQICTNYIKLSQKRDGCFGSAQVNQTAAPATRTSPGHLRPSAGRVKHLIKFWLQRRWNIKILQTSYWMSTHF